MKKRLFSTFSLKNTSVLLGLLVTVCFLSSCSKSDKATPGVPAGKTAKFTVTVNGASSGSYVSFVFSGVSNDLSGSNKTIWKVNGVTRSNEEVISLDEDDFTGSTHTYVVESTTPLAAISTSVQCLAPGADSYTVSYTAEVNGKVSGDYQNVTVTANEDFTHQFSY